jgi:hypothetical protein
MDKDPQLGDTILHKAGYIIREAVENGMEGEKEEKALLPTGHRDKVSSSSS